MRATFLSIMLGVAGGFATTCGLTVAGFVALGVALAKEPPSPIHYVPKRPSFEWAFEGTCDWPKSDCRIATMGGTR